MAKRAYSDMEAELKREFGDDILDQMNALYDMPDNEKQTYLELFPKVQEAMNAKNEYIVWTPLLSAYYGSIDTVSRYYTTQMYVQLEKEFGDDIQQKVDYYVSLLNEGESKAASAYKKQYLADYYKRKDELQTKVNLQTIQTAQMIPERKDYAIRPDFVQGQATGLQEEMLQYINTDQQQQLAQEMYGQLSEATVSFLNEYYQGGELTKAEMNAMENSVDYVARRYGLSLQEALRLLGLER